MLSLRRCTCVYVCGKRERGERVIQREEERRGGRTCTERIARVPPGPEWRCVPLHTDGRRDDGAAGNIIEEMCVGEEEEEED